MSNQGDIVFAIGADVTGLTQAGQAGERSLAEMEKAAKQLEKQIERIGEAGVSFQRDLNALTGVTREFSKSARDSAAAFDAFDRSRAQVDALRASIDPLFAASKRYEQALVQLDSALEMGTISARQHEQMVEQLAAAYLRADAAADVAAGGMRGMQGGLQQVGFQIQDFAVQVGAGTSATQAFAQQFPQLASAFGPVGLAVGTLAAIGLPLLVAAFGSGIMKANEFAVALDNLSTSTATAKDQLFMLQAGLDTMEQVKLYQEIGALIAEQTRLREEAVYAEGVVAQHLIDQADAKQAQIDAARAKLAEDKRIRAEIEAILQRTQAAVTAASDLSTKMASAYAVYAQTRTMAAELADETERAAQAAQAFSAYQAELARTGQSSGPDSARSRVQFGGGAFRAPVTGAGLPFVASDDGSGGGGGGGGGANPLVAQLEALRQQMMTEEQIEAESYAKRQEMLQQALDQQLITQQEYAALMQNVNADHQSKMADIDVMRYGGALDKAEAFMGGMASILQHGGEKQQRIAAIFGAAQALISTYQGAAKELEKGTFGFASAASVISKGLGLVAAIRGAGRSTSAATGGGAVSGGGAASGGTAVAASAPTQTLNFHLTNDPMGFGERLMRQIVAQLNEAGRNGMTIRGNVIT